MAFEQLCQRAISTWTSLNDTLPHDEVAAGYDPFGWEWDTQSRIQNASNRRENIPGGATINEFVDAQHPCKITGSTVYFAIDPHDPLTQTDYFWSDSCGSGCLDNVFDFLGAAAHEYGHSLGLDHVPDRSALMYASMNGGTAKNDPSQCECDFVRKIFRDNFGPSRLDSFVVKVLETGGVACTWSPSVEAGCRRYRVSKTCEDGAAYVLADSMPCLGPGVVQTVIDSAVCPGLTLYSLSQVDSIGPNLVQEIILDERGCTANPAPGAMRAVRLTARVDAIPTPPGFSTPEDAVRALGISVTQRDDEQYRRIRADGFMYITRDSGLFWGKSIDGILEDQMRACLVASDSSLDSLEFMPQETTYPSPSVAQVTAGVQYGHKCGTADATWQGQVLAIVERKNPDDGWRIRQVTELW